MDNKITSTKIKNTLNRIKTGKHPDATVKKRRLSRMILLIDGLVIVLILLFMYNRQPDKVYHSQALTYDECEYRFSVSGLPGQNKLFFSLSILSKKKQRTVIYFNKTLATMAVMYNNDVIYNNIFGKDITSLALQPDESKTFVLQANQELLQAYAATHPAALINDPQKIFSFKKTNLPITVELTLQTGKKLTTALHFNYEVQQDD
jgi:hypothetical protein